MQCCHVLIFHHAGNQAKLMFGKNPNMIGMQIQLRNSNSLILPYKTVKYSCYNNGIYF